MHPFQHSSIFLVHFLKACLFQLHHQHMLVSSVCFIAVLSFSEKEDPLQCRLKAITALCLCDSTLWVGAGTGILLTLPVSKIVTLLSARHGRVSVSPQPLLDDNVHEDSAGPSAVCSFQTARVAQWCHWGAVRCLVPVKFSHPSTGQFGRHKPSQSTSV